MAKDVSKNNTHEIIIPHDKLEYLQKELSNIREEFKDNKYIKEAFLSLSAGALRGTIGSYWNAVSDDLRRKVMHRSLDLFNKEVKPKKEIKAYEDFQKYITDYDLIEGAYKIGVINLEGQKLLHQALETRHIFDGHPDSSDPTLFKVFNLIADCNRYVLSEPYPISIIDINQYILTMDSDIFNKNSIAIEQAFTDLPNIYKDEMSNKLLTLYIGDSASTRLKSNIELSFPILWEVIPKEVRQQLGKRFDKLIVDGNKQLIDNAIEIFTFIDGFRYISNASRKMIFEPVIDELIQNLDKWGKESQLVKYLQRLGTNIPESLIEKYVSALTLTYVGYRGSGAWGRTSFFSDGAAPVISSMFEKFDNASAEAFIKTISTNDVLKARIKNIGQLNRLRTLGQILLNKSEIRADIREFLELLVNDSKTNEFYSKIK